MKTQDERKMNKTTSPNNRSEILTYFSHSYRPEDEKVNSFFWNLFFDEGFFFTVDPKSDFLSIPYLEAMMQRSTCFVAVVPYREEELFTRCSPYIAFEYRLAERAQKPRLIFIEEHVSGKLFNKEDFLPFNKNRLEYSKNEFIARIKKLAEPYYGVRNQDVRLHNKVGIVIDKNKYSRNVYTPDIIDELRQAISRFGYDVRILWPDQTEDFLISLDRELFDFILLDISESLTSQWILGWIHGRFIPTIRLYHLRRNESEKLVQLSPLISSYRIESKGTNSSPVLFWSNASVLIDTVSKHIQKFDQRRTEFHTKSEGERYFRSLGRKPAKVFISNASEINEMAKSLVWNLRLNNIPPFHYKEPDAIEIGRPWLDELHRSLESSDIFVALITDEYYRKQFCIHEITMARELYAKGKIEIFPYLVHASKFDIVGDLQFHDLSDLSSEEAVASIVKDIDEFLKKKYQEELKGEGDEYKDESLRKKMHGKGKQWAILIGANYYEDTINYPTLQVCVKDAVALKEQIVKSGYDERRVRTLTDQSDELPTRDNILTALKSIATATEPDDLLLFYYSGHGVEKGGESYLVGRTGRHMVIEETSVSMSKVKEIMRSAQARAKVIIIDACHSGVNFGKGPEVMTEEFIRRVFEEAKGFAILASCEQGQKSYEWRKNDRSVFTHYLLESLRGKADYQEKGLVTLQDINKYVTDRVKLWSSEHNLSQTPTLHYEVSGDIILVRL